MKKIYTRLIIVNSKEFIESDHPRDEKGRFKVERSSDGSFGSVALSGSEDIQREISKLNELYRAAQDDSINAVMADNKTRFSAYWEEEKDESWEDLDEIDRQIYIDKEFRHKLEKLDEELEKETAYERKVNVRDDAIDLFTKELEAAGYTVNMIKSSQSDSRYLYAEDERTGESIKIRISDHNQTSSASAHEKNNINIDTNREESIDEGLEKLRILIKRRIGNKILNDCTPFHESKVARAADGTFGDGGSKSEGDNAATLDKIRKIVISYIPSSFAGSLEDAISYLSYKAKTSPELKEHLKFFEELESSETGEELYEQGRGIHPDEIEDREESEKNLLVEKGRSAISPPPPELTSAQKEGIADYTGATAFSINEFLRKKEEMEVLGLKDQIRAEEALHGETIAALDSIFEDARIHEDVIIYRGMSRSVDLRVGDTFTNPAYTSTSLSQDIARDFGRGSHFVISALAGSKGIFVEDYTSSHDEFEVLLPRNAELIVVGIEDSAHGPIYHMEYRA